MGIQKIKKKISELAKLACPVKVPTFTEVTNGQCIVLELSDEVIELVNDRLSLEFYKRYDSLSEYLDYNGFIEEELDKDSGLELLPYIQTIFPNVINVYLTYL